MPFLTVTGKNLVVLGVSAGGHGGAPKWIRGERGPQKTVMINF